MKPATEKTNIDQLVNMQQKTTTYDQQEIARESQPAIISNPETMHTSPCFYKKIIRYPSFKKGVKKYDDMIAWHSEDLKET